MCCADIKLLIVEVEDLINDIFFLENVGHKRAVKIKATDINLK